MKSLKETLIESVNEAKAVSFSDNAEAARTAVMDGADAMIKFLNSPAKLNKYFADYDFDRKQKMAIYDLLAELASDLYTWMTEADIYENIEDDDDMNTDWGNRKDNAFDDYGEETIDPTFEIWPKVWKDVVKFDWIW